MILASITTIWQRNTTDWAPSLLELQPANINSKLAVIDARDRAGNRGDTKLTVSDERIAEVVARFRAETGGTSFVHQLKIQPTAVEKGSATFEVLIEELHLRTMGIAHGGVIATLLDSSLGCACWTLAPPDHHLVTVQLNINYIRPAWLGEKLIAIAEVRHAGQMTSVSRGEVRNAAGALVASATGTFMYLPVPGGPKPVMEKRDETERWTTS